MAQCDPCAHGVHGHRGQEGPDRRGGRRAGDEIRGGAGDDRRPYADDHLYGLRRGVRRGGRIQRDAGRAVRDRVCRTASLRVGERPRRHPLLHGSGALLRRQHPPHAVRLGQGAFRSFRDLYRRGGRRALAFRQLPLHRVRHGSLLDQPGAEADFRRPGAVAGADRLLVRAG